MTPDASPDDASPDDASPDNDSASRDNDDNDDNASRDNDASLDTDRAPFPMTHAQTTAQEVLLFMERHRLSVDALCRILRLVCNTRPSAAIPTGELLHHLV